MNEFPRTTIGDISVSANDHRQPTGFSAYTHCTHARANPPNGIRGPTQSPFAEIIEVFPHQCGWIRSCARTPPTCMFDAHSRSEQRTGRPMNDHLHPQLQHHPANPLRRLRPLRSCPPSWTIWLPNGSDPAAAYFTNDVMVDKVHQGDSPDGRACAA